MLIRNAVRLEPISNHHFLGAKRGFFFLIIQHAKYEPDIH